MRTYWRESAHNFFLLAVPLLLAACGGGGGGGSSNAVVYAGNVNPAIVSSANASQLTANVVGGNDIAATILGLSIDGGDPVEDLGGGVMDVGLRLNRNFRDILVQAQRSSAAQQAARTVVINESEPCEGSGSVRTSGTLRDDTGTGILSVTFDNCSLDGVILNGPASLNVEAVDFDFLIPTIFTISFSRLTLRGVGLNVDISGSLRTEIVIATDTETITQNFVTLDNTTNLMTKIEDFEVESVYDDILNPTSFTSNLNGRVFDQANGYVDITTTVPLVFNTLSQLFPDSGQIMLTGADNRRVRVTALSATLVMLELDIDGDGSVDHTARLKWTELDGPVGADLADTDGDLMHNSWETANGLNPDANDAAGDPDSDAATNLSEYQSGTDPNDINSHP